MPPSPKRHREPAIAEALRGRGHVQHLVIDLGRAGLALRAIAGKEKAELHLGLRNSDRVRQPAWLK